MQQTPIIVVKVGSSSIVDTAGQINHAVLHQLVWQLNTVWQQKVRPILVTSGARAVGRGVVYQRYDDSSLADSQALAAIGQGVLMSSYTQLFAEHQINTAQVLLTVHEFGTRVAYLNARNTFERLLSWRTIPIVNENDTTATEEITLGENDRLAALVAALVRADQLIILTDMAGVFSADPRINRDASLIEEIAGVDAAVEQVAGGANTAVGSGGMAAKVAAAKIASWSGVPCTITSAQEPDVLIKVLKGESVGTKVHPRKNTLTARKVWIAFACLVKGSIIIDDGAVNALVGRGKSLLPVGIQKVMGKFESGEAIEIFDHRMKLIAKGLSAYSANELLAFLKQKTVTSTEAVHRDDLVVLAN